jgi:hypothetical protein
MDACSCVPLALVVYNSREAQRPNAITTSEPDYVGMVLFACSIVQLLLGLSLASNPYPWVSWQIILPLALGSLSLLLFVGRELRPNLALTSYRGMPAKYTRLLCLTKYKSADAIVAFSGALVLGMVV